jgi:hypothetical protein
MPKSNRRLRSLCLAPGIIGTNRGCCDEKMATLSLNSFPPTNRRILNSMIASSSGNPCQNALASAQALTAIGF